MIWWRNGRLAAILHLQASFDLNVTEKKSRDSESVLRLWLTVQESLFTLYAELQEITDNKISRLVESEEQICISFLSDRLTVNRVTFIYS